MDDKDVIIARQQKEIEELRALVTQLRDEIARLKNQNSSNSSKPPSSDIINPQPRVKRKKRKHGGQSGHRRCQRQLLPPEQVDETILHELPDDEVQRRRLIPLDEYELSLQQINLPKKLIHVTEHHVRLYETPTGRIVKAKLPASIRKAGLFAPPLQAMVGYFKARCHMSYSTLRDCLAEVFGLPVCAGYLTKVCTKSLSTAFQPAYAEVAATIRNSAVVGTDETGHNDTGQLHWVWCQQDRDAAFFHISDSRGSKVLRKILGKDFPGVLQCDYFSANKKYVQDHSILVQYCWAHLIRDIKSLGESLYSSVRRWSEGLLQIARKIFRVWKSRRERPRWENSLQTLKKVFLQKMRKPPDYGDARTLAKRFRGRTGEQNYFLFLDVSGVEPTNNRTEQAIRHVVIDRRVTQGTRSNAGMRFCERAWTIIATCIRQGKSIYQFFLHALQAALNPYLPYPTLIPVNP
ncbi:MAG: IS66 family transposase [Phycisphaerae bacterium]|nr:IS66 family transposase [Phycisphaerae bacterium]